MNVFEAYIVSSADLTRTAALQGIAVSTVRRRLEQLGINDAERARYRDAATIGRAAGRLFRELYEERQKLVPVLQKQITRDYATLSYNQIRALESNIRESKSTKVLSRRKSELEYFLNREEF